MEKISAERKKQLQDFCRKLDLKIKNLELLDLAFHHCSYSNEMNGGKYNNNERLEFLGDSVLGLATADFLYKDMSSNHAEGDLAKIKSVVVSEKSLAPVALSFGIDKMLVMGRGEEMSGGRTKPAILADCMEAVIGAYFRLVKHLFLSLLFQKYAKFRKPEERILNLCFRNYIRRKKNHVLYTN